MWQLCFVFVIVSSFGLGGGCYFKCLYCVEKKNMFIETAYLLKDLTGRLFFNEFYLIFMHIFLYNLFQEKPAVRAQAIILFGNLSRFGDGPSKAPFLEQIHSNFVSLLLHLNDPEIEVKKVSYSLF